MTANFGKHRMHVAGHESSISTTAKPIYTSELPALHIAIMENKTVCGIQEDASVRRASGVASTSARQAVGLDACLQVTAAFASVHSHMPLLPALAALSNSNCQAVS